MSLPGGQAFAIAPGVGGYITKSLTLQSPGIYTLYTMPANGRLWGASAAYGMGCSGGSGTQLGYARVRIQAGEILAIVNCCIAGTVDSDSGSISETYYGVQVPKGTVFVLDVNGGTGISGGVNQGSGLVRVSMP